MNPFLFVALFSLFPLALAAKEDWDTGFVKNLYAILITLGAVGFYVIAPELWKANLNVAGLLIWGVVLVLALYNEKKKGAKLLGIADIYLGLALTLLLGMWVNFLWFAMSIGLFVFLFVKIVKKPEVLKNVFSERTRLVPFYLIGLIALLLVLFFK